MKSVTEILASLEARVMTQLEHEYDSYLEAYEKYQSLTVAEFLSMLTYILADSEPLSEPKPDSGYPSTTDSSYRSQGG